MSQRQGRRSTGPAPLPQQTSQDRRDQGFVEQQKFDDFRRRHREQNKDIILDNVERKKIIKTLQDEISILQNELLDMRRRNMALKSRVKKMERENSRLGGADVLKALDHLLAAAPALYSLRQSLSSLPTPPPSASYKQASNTRPTLTFIGNPTATWPAANGKQRQDLGAVMESEEGEWMDDRRVTSRSRGRGRQTDVGSIAASRLPRPKTPVSPARSSVSPSPKKVTSARKVSTKRRRESGLLSTRPRSCSPEMVNEQGLVVDEEPVGETSEWEEGPVVEMKPDEALALVQEEDQVEFSGQGKEKTIEAEAEVGEVNKPEPDYLVAESEPSRPSDSTITDNTEPEGRGRGRRARASVISYKEPSLVKKMRKPDGIQTQDVIKTLTRKSISPRRVKSSLSPKRTKKDVYTTSPPSPTPLIPEGTFSSRSASTRTANLSASSQSMRRKSTLPKANSRSRGKQEEVRKTAGAGDKGGDGLEEYEDIHDGGEELDLKFGRSLQIDTGSGFRKPSSSSALSHNPAMSSNVPKTLPTISVPAITIISPALSASKDDTLSAALSVDARPVRSTDTGVTTSSRRQSSVRGFKPTSTTRLRDVLTEVRPSNVETKPAPEQDLKKTAREVARGMREVAVLQQ
ncbi:hypothetical protein I314_06006 [Cryptococcus bacillisporus CA1873]|uniref:Shugoshin C-terminal domain-containing protein n=1 Tax=Cryptococcus bacillisporus CA1873 TaxID=1296111 RepID=A0ABR5B368_CRYGA|nr:hypothetical protein I314_06006 [Cryptococcus bacillisporus CA1873]|eukprot:KIR58041.1 hypothetical protein I314_06006 [Cryptococcus gattii CA1873]